MQFENCGCVFQIACLGFAAGGLDFAELIQSLVELAGEPMAVHAEIGEGALLAAKSFGDGEAGVEVGDVDIDAAGRGGERQQIALQGGDSIEAPGGVGKILDQLLFGGTLGLVFVEKGLGVTVERGRIFRGECGRLAGQSVANRVER